MRAFSRVAGAFVLMLGVGYLLLLAFVPKVPTTDSDGPVMTGRSVADQLTHEARALMKQHKSGPPPGAAAR